MQLQVPFVVYWLIVKDFFWNLDICEDTSTEHGYCMSNSECNNIANGTIIGSCGSEESGQACCHITVNYYNATYSLTRLFTAKNPTDKPQKLTLFSSKSHKSFQTDSNNRRISSKRSERETQVVLFNERVHICMSPDRIVWPITASYSRESREFKRKRPFSGTTYLYIVELNKVYDEEERNLTVECLSKLNISEPDESETEENEKRKIYLKMNKEVLFPLRKFFTPEIQNLKNTNFTDNFEDLFPKPEPQDDKLELSNYGTCEEDSNCEKEKSVASEVMGSRELFEEIVRSQSDMTSDIEFRKRSLMDYWKPYDLTNHALLEMIQNIRKPVETDPTHDMRKPVENEDTHDMRNPVSLDESHDQRWPVIEEETDLRNVYDEDYETSLINLFKERLAKAPTLDCTTKIPLTDEHVRNFDPSKVENLTRFREETDRACGDFSEETEDRLGIMPNPKWPWMVSLLEKKSGMYKNKCSAALINSKWVITVAHCVDMKYKSDFKLLLGNKNSERKKGSYIESEIEDIFIHPDFKRGMFENDLALLRMKTPVEYNSDILPICLPYGEPDLVEYGIPIFLSGKHNQNSESLQSSIVPIMTNKVCERFYSVGTKKEKIKDTFICVGKKDGNCDSESGSSLISPDTEDKWLLIGLVSWGSMCSNLEQPSVYVKINSYKEWIRNVIDCYELYR